MKAIRNKGHRVGNVANDDLYQKEKRRQPKHGDETAFFSTVSTHFKLICKKITILITVDDRTVTYNLYNTLYIYICLYYFYIA